ncbi:MAG: M14 family zinc carboxypeptidase [Bacteroidales bacterium]|nr:M14 family zinc carboxypeptidase [Bacteroidales bacterium]
MKNLITAVIIFLITCSFSITDAQVQKYSKARIYFNGREDMLKLAKLGFPLEEGELKKDVYLISDFSADELNLIRKNGFNFDVLIDDVVKYYVARNQNASKDFPVATNLNNCFNISSYTTPASYTGGSMGGYLTYSELLSELDNMKTNFPDLITDRIQIDNFTTVEGREMFYVKISKNPGVTEAEPKVLYTALTHAREPVGMQQLVFFMYYILENYNTNPEVKYLLDNTELYFIPIVNIDGYVYNESTNPTGGGMWRKNRKDNGDGTFGIDLNRNFGYMWGCDTIGSSYHTSAETYRGTAAFSEPETQAVKWLCEHFQLSLALNYHTYSSLLIYPWDFNNTATPDSNIFNTFGTTLCEEYNLNNGTTMETVGYISNGDADDWMYGEQSTKGKMFAMTPELGTGADGFWAPLARIIPICKENLKQDINLARLVQKYGRVEDASPSVINKVNGYIKFNIQHLGFGDPATLTVSVETLGTEFTNIGMPKVYSTLSILQKITDSISYSLNPLIAKGQQIKYVLVIDNGAITYRDTITKVFGFTTVIFSDACNNMNNWTSSTGGGWGTSTTVYHSSTASITDSPSGNYSNNKSSTLTFKTGVYVNLVNAKNAELTFWEKFYTEKCYDYLQIKIATSTNGGSTWSAYTPLCGKYTKNGTNAEKYIEPVIDGRQFAWIEEKINLNDYLEKYIKFQFSFKSDNYTNFDGFYFDDFKVTVVYDTTTSASNNNNLSEEELSNPIPNPANNLTYINYNISKESRLYVYNSLGQEVFVSQNVSGKGQLQIEISDFKPGIYYYNLKSGNYNSQTRKLVRIM